MSTYKLNEIVGGADSARLLGRRSCYLHGRADPALRRGGRRAVIGSRCRASGQRPHADGMSCQTPAGGQRRAAQGLRRLFRGSSGRNRCLITRGIDRATEIWAQYGFKTPDAIHLAAAVASGCNVFLTNDHRLDRFTDITIEVVQPA